MPSPAPPRPRPCPAGGAVPVPRGGGRNPHHLQAETPTKGLPACYSLPSNNKIYIFFIYLFIWSGGIWVSFIFFFLFIYYFFRNSLVSKPLLISLFIIPAAPLPRRVQLGPRERKAEPPACLASLGADGPGRAAGRALRSAAILNAGEIPPIALIVGWGTCVMYLAISFTLGNMRSLKGGAPFPSILQ